MSLPALSFSICSCSICFNRFMAILRRRRRARGAQAAGSNGVGELLLESFGLVTFSAVIPGLSAGQGPESITTSRDYEFRARALRNDQVSVCAASRGPAGAPE